MIFLTAMEQTTDEAKGFELGAADYITKPVNPPILQARVRTHLALKQSMDELQAAYAIIKKHSDRMEQELSVGHDIQMSMVPLAVSAIPDRSEFSLHATLKPAREVGGDFYDFFFVDDDHAVPGRWRRIRQGRARGAVHGGHQDDDQVAGHR